MGMGIGTVSFSTIQKNRHGFKSLDLAIQLQGSIQGHSALLFITLASYLCLILSYPRSDKGPKLPLVIKKLR